MNIFLIAVSSFMLALSGALVPGPLFTITVSASVKKGFSAGPLIILGHGLIEMLIIVLVIFGIAPFLSSEHTRFAISVVGGFLLTGMGAMLVKDAGRAKVGLASTGKSSGMNPVISGIVGSISNPYWVLWWVTIGLGYLLSSMKYGAAGIIAFFGGHISADLMWYSLISFAVSRGRGMIGDTGYRFLLYACGLFLIFFGLWFIKAA